MSMTIEADAPTVTEQSVRLTTAQLASVASVGVAASTTKTDSDVIKAIQVSVTDGLLHAIATDRYRVARLTCPTVPDADDLPASDLEPVIIPVDLLQGFTRALKAAKSLRHSPFIVLTIDGDKITLSDIPSGVTMSGLKVSGNFPPVARLIPTEDSAFGLIDTISLLPRFVGDAQKLSLPSDPTAAATKDAGFKVRFLKSENPNKPAPILFTRTGQERDSKELLEYLVQPRLVLR